MENSILGLEDGLIEFSYPPLSEVHSVSSTGSHSRDVFLSNLAFLLFFNVISMYFLDWNILILTIRTLQLFLVSHAWKRNNPLLSKVIFYAFVVLSNALVLLVHLFYQGVQPLTLVFVGDPVVGHWLLLLATDLLIVILQSVILLNDDLLKIID